MIPIFSPDMQKEPWVIKIQDLYKQLAIDIAAIHAAEAAQRAIDDANRNAVLQAQQQWTDLQAERIAFLNNIQQQLIERFKTK